MTDSIEHITTGHNKTVRLQSLDALRGFDMFWIISGEGIFHGLANAVMINHALTRNPENWQISVSANLSLFEKILIDISNQLYHTPWNGFTFYDMIFPLFIFIAGVSMPYSFDKQLNGTVAVNRKIAKQKIYAALIKRTIILMVLGMVVNGLFKWQGYENTRFASVLGRIALSCFFAAVIYLNCSLKKQVIWFAVILLGYWVAMMLVPVPGYGPAVLTPEGNLEAYIDRMFLPGKLHRKIYDPEGLFSTIPAIASAMLGVFTGKFLQWPSEKWNRYRKTLVLIISGILLLGAGLLWGLVFPVNKNMWTSSFVLFAGGCCVLLLALFYLVIDVWGYQKWSMPFVWIGTNSILIYMAAHGLVNFESTSRFLLDGLINRVPENLQSALLWTGVAFVQLGALYFLYRKKWFLKL